MLSVSFSTGVKFCLFHTQNVYESCYVCSRRLSFVLHLLRNRLWRGISGSNESPTKFKSCAGHHRDHSLVHRRWFRGYARHDHWVRIRFRLDRSMEWRTNTHNIYFGNKFEHHASGEQPGECSDCKVDSRKSIPRRRCIPSGRFFRE